MRLIQKSLDIYTSIWIRKNNEKLNFFAYVQLGKDKRKDHNPQVEQAVMVELLKKGLRNERLRYNRADAEIRFKQKATAILVKGISQKKIQQLSRLAWQLSIFKLYNPQVEQAVLVELLKMSD